MTEQHTSLQTIPWPIHRLTAQGDESLTAQVVAEAPLEIVLNGRPVATLMRLPGDEKELAAGFCVTEGLIARFADILLLHHCGRSGDGGDDDCLESRNRVVVTANPQGVRPRQDWSRLIRSGCGSIDPGDLVLDGLMPVAGHLHIASGILLGLNHALLSAPRLYHKTGGLHAAALFQASGQLVVVREDIGRHNAVDKVIGHALFNNISMADKILFTTGRASHEMVTKAVRAGIPVLASVSSPTSLAVELAQRLNLTLIGYLRGTRMNVYTHGERVTG